MKMALQNTSPFRPQLRPWKEGGLECEEHPKDDFDDGSHRGAHRQRPLWQHLRSRRRRPVPRQGD